MEVTNKSRNHFPFHGKPCFLANRCRVLKLVCCRYPDKLAWQLNITKKDIRRSEALFKLHNFMICENESGNITRQEAVSMLPPLCLDVEPHHKVC